MEILTSIPSLAFAGNFPDIEISSSEKVDFQLVVGPYLIVKVLYIYNEATPFFTVGDIVTGSNSGAQGIVYDVGGETEQLTCIIGQITEVDFVVGEELSDGTYSPEITGLEDYSSISDQYDQEKILTETYTPNEDDLITIELKELFEQMVETNIPESALLDQTTAYRQLTLKIADAEPITIFIIKGGIQALNIPDKQFINSSFLSWQEPVKYVKESDPEYLSYFTSEEVKVRAKAYFSNATSNMKDLYTMQANKFYTFRTSWSYLKYVFGGDPVKFEVWAENTEGSSIDVVTNLQTYLLTDEAFDHDDLFLFINSLGGVDTIRFTGKSTRIERFDIDTAFFNRKQREYFVTANRQWDKNTGDFRSRRHFLWARDFFASAYRFKYVPGQLFRVFLESGQELSSIRYTLTAYSFRYIESEQTLYQNYLELFPGEVEDEEGLWVQVPEGDFILTPEGDKLEYY